MSIFDGATDCACGAPLRATRTDLDGCMITVHAFCNICEAKAAPVVGVGADSPSVIRRAIERWNRQRASEKHKLAQTRTLED